MDIKQEIEAKDEIECSAFVNTQQAMHCDSIKQEYNLMEEQGGIVSISDRAVENESFDPGIFEDRVEPEYIDIKQLNTESYIKNEIDRSFHQERIKCELIKIEKQDTSDSALFTNEKVKIEDMYPDRLEWMDSVSSDIDTTILQTDLDIKHSDASTTSNILSKSAVIRREDRATQRNADGTSFSCYHCNYIFRSKRRLISHMEVHQNKKNMLSCLPCNRTFERQITLNEHILRTHPNFIAFITSKIHECTLCAFKTTRSDCFKDHLLKHPEANTNYKFRTCAHCNVAFKKKVSLDNHMLNKHPNFISSVTHKIHKCTECNYRTTMSNHLKRHLLKHTETPTNHKLWTCTLCPAGFNSKRSLDDHILRNHPHSIAFVTYKIHECTLCTFKTTRSDWFQKHLLKHPGTFSNYKFFTCRHCNTTFKTKTLLDNHVIKKHPNSTSSVTNKIHRCTECNYKTTKSTDLKKHSLKHTEIPDSRLLSTCAFCPAGFKSKRSLDQHIVKKHPNCIASVTKKILKCRKCTYKTTISSHLKSHLLKHSKAPA